MRIDLASILGQWNKTEELKSKGKPASNYTTQPQKGQIIKGQIIDIQQNRVSIKLDDGQIVEAKLTDKFEFVIGDKLSFMVKESNIEQLLLKPLIDGSQTEGKLNDILKAAGLPITEKNMEIVTKLIEKQMPIDKKTLTDMSMYSKRFPESKVDQLIFLMKNDIIISKDSIHYVGELLKNKVSISENLNTFNTGVADIVEKASGSIVVETILKENEPAINVFAKIKNFFSKQEDQVLVPQEKLNVPMTTLMTRQEANALLNETNTIIKESMHQQSTADKQDVVNNQAGTNQDLQIKESSLDMFLSEKGKAFSDLFSTVEGLDIPDDIKFATNKLLAQRVTKSMLNNELLMKKDDLVDVDKINKHYNKVYNKIMDVLNLNIQDTSESVQKVLKEASNIKNNVEMMNQLQQNHQFLHLPIVLNDQNINSEIYIMNNKTSKKSSEERVTALLRLDLRNLGQLDIYVAKTAKNVEITFYVEKDSTIDDIRNHSSQLSKKLLEESFNVLGIGVLMKEKEFNIFEDFFDNKDDNESKRFTFDMRA